MPDYTVGLDVSFKKTAVCVKDENGKIVKEKEVPSYAEDIDGFLSKHFARKDLKKLGVEAGQWTRYLALSLRKCGYNVIVMESHDVAVKTRTLGAKTDVRDARALADFLRGNLYKEVHIKCDEHQMYRTLLNLRDRSINARVKHQNAIRGSLKDFGYSIGSCIASKYRERVWELIENDSMLWEIMEPTITQLEHAVEHEATYTKMILDIAKHHEIMRLMMTVPYVGPITAFAFVATIDNPLRFRKSRQVGAYLGLVPKTRQSGEIDQKAGITKEGDKLLRSLLVEAATGMLCKNSKWNTLNSWGARMCGRKSSKRIAVVAMARKMAVMMHRMWLDETEYCPTKVDLEAVAAEAA